MKTATAIIRGVAVAAGAFVLDKLVSIAFVAIIKDYGWWAYPMHLAPGLLLGAIVLLSKKGREYGEKAGELFSKSKFWRWARLWGAFWLVFAGCFSTSPLLGAAFARFLNLENRKAWRYVFVSSFISSVFWVSAYRGLITQFVSWFS